MPGVPERKAEIIPYSNFMNLNAPDQGNACEGRWKILLCVFVVIADSLSRPFSMALLSDTDTPRYYPW